EPGRPRLSVNVEPVIAIPSEGCADAKALRADFAGTNCRRHIAPNVSVMRGEATDELSVVAFGQQSVDASLKSPRVRLEASGCQRRGGFIAATDPLDTSPGTIRLEDGGAIIADVVTRLLWCHCAAVVLARILAKHGLSHRSTLF